MCGIYIVVVLYIYLSYEYTRMKIYVENEQRCVPEGVCPPSLSISPTQTSFHI